MELTFLSGPIPLTKTIAWNARGSQFTVTPYPLVQKVTSHVEVVESIDQFAAQLKIHGAMGHTLLKGSLDRPIVNESRATRAMDLPHQWIVFDFDKVDCAPTYEGAVQAVTKYLPVECHKVDCIIQLSSSCFRPDATHLSCHVYMLLAKPMATKLMTEWLTHINFTSSLQGEMRLTDSGMALHFPLDRTVTSPAKLIYIAPPRCVGFKPAVQESVYILRGSQRELLVPTFTAPSPSSVAARINELRAALNLPAWEYKTRQHPTGVEIMIDAEECHVHDIKPSGDGYIRFNMNGGDSLAYFINLREPGLIGNHKGEPYLLTSVVAPDLFKALTKAAKSTPAKNFSPSMEPLAFFATNRKSDVYIGYYDRANDELRLEPSTAAAAASWMTQHGVPIKQNLPHYDIVYDMTSDIRFEDGYPVINLYRQSDLMRKFSDVGRTLPCGIDALLQFKEKCPVIYRTVSSIVSGDELAILRLVNWIAAIFQRRTRTNAAWVLHGVQGTGKGMFINHIMKPLLGPDTVTVQLYSALDKDFNEFLDGKLLVVFDEAEMGRSMDWSTVRSKVYNWITEPTVSIRPMHRGWYDAPNHCNFLLLSNSSRPIVIEEGDRRFNVPEQQSKRLFYTANEYASLVEQDELPAFANLLGMWMVEEELLLKPLESMAKQRIYESTHSLLERIAKAVQTGDTQFFVEARPDELQMRTDHFGKSLPLKEYDALLHAMADGSLTVIKPTDLYVLFRMVTAGDKIFPETRASQRQIYLRFGLLPTDKDVHLDGRSGKSARGIKAPSWRIDERVKSDLADIAGGGAGDTEVASVVVPIRNRPG